MPFYEVAFTALHSITVEAEDEDSAIDRAFEKIDSTIVDVNWVSEDCYEISQDDI